MVRGRRRTTRDAAHAPGVSPAGPARRGPWRDPHALLAAAGAAVAVVVPVGLLPLALEREPRLSDPAVAVSALLLVLVVGLLEWRAAGRVVDGHRTVLEAALVDAARVRAQHEARAEEVEHDARSALGALRSALSTLERYDDQLDRGLAHRLQAAALREVDHLEQLIRLREPAPPEPDATGTVDFDVREVVRDVALTRQVAGLRVRTDGVHGRAHGSPGDLATVLGNLLVNAMRHAPGAAVEITSAVVGDRLELRVRDDGPGLLPALAASVFERGTHGGHHLSTGLGLYVSRRLLRELGGDLRLEASGPGCCFLATLPAASRGTPAPHPVPHERHPAGRVRVPADVRDRATS